jgi:DNA invertase Pin-like site-specific DNA recombinase
VKAVAYVRVSTDEQAEHGVSIDAQVERIEAYARLYDLDLVALCKDEGISGKARDRAGLDRALQGLQRGEAQALVVAKLDRLTRSLPHLLSLVERFFGDRFVLLSVAEHLDPRTASGRLVINMLGVIAQWELETIGERTREALRYKRARGEYTGGGTPYGYQVVDGKLVEVEAELKVIQQARMLRACGHSLRQIGHALAMPPRGGGIWTPQQVKRLLGNGKEG